MRNKDDYKKIHISVASMICLLTFNTVQDFYSYNEINFIQYCTTNVIVVMFDIQL